MTANTLATASGRVRMVCQYCDRRTAPRALDDVPRGWSVAPYPSTYTHGDGSRGSLYTCPTCAADPVGREPLEWRGR